MNIDISLLVNICLCILSFLLALISVITVVVTLRQNHTMIENESRAYISIYGDVTNCQGAAFYLIIKNFGKSNAIILSLECDTDLSRFSYFKERIPFLHMKDALIAPGQSFKCTLQHVLLFNSEIQFINFKVSYKSNNKKYSETFCINLQSFSDLIQTNATSKGNELYILSNTLQDINRRLL